MKMLTSLPTELDEPYVYFGAQQAEIWAKLYNDHPQNVIPCWVPFRDFAKRQFGTDALIVRTMEHHKKPFVWATEFSNVHSFFYFDEPGFEIDSQFYASPEHYYQLMKSSGMPDHEVAVAEMGSAKWPEQAFRVGRRHSIRPDWDVRRNQIMAAALWAKFQNLELRALLLSTGNHRLVDVKPTDGYWGTGSDGHGANTLGVLLMEVRELLSKTTQQ